MLLGIKIISISEAFDKFNDENVSKTQPAAVNKSYSRVASSSLGGSSEEHQMDKNSPCGSENMAVRTFVWRSMKFERKERQKRDGRGGGEEGGRES